MGSKASNADRTQFESHRFDAAAENVAFRVQHGMSYEAACEAEGVLPDTLVKRAKAAAARADRRASA